MCCLSGRDDIHICHLHEGSGTSSNQKVSDVLVLPMCHLLHRAQHKHPTEFWPMALPRDDPSASLREAKDWAVRLDDRWQARDLEGAEALLADMRRRASRSYLAQFLL
jgi:hypothetical protein